MLKLTQMDLRGAVHQCLGAGDLVAVGIEAVAGVVAMERG